MNRTDEEVEAEVSRQEQQAAQAAELDTQIEEYNAGGALPVKKWEWCDAASRLDVRTTLFPSYWRHACGERYYQLDHPGECYLGCEEEEQCLE